MQKPLSAGVEVLRPFRQQNVLMETCHECGKCAWEVPSLHSAQDMFKNRYGGDDEMLYENEMSETAW